MTHKKKLVLFDIDGTLISRTGDLMDSLGRFPYAIENMFGIKLGLGVDDYMRYNGFIDKAMLWELVKERGVARETYEREFLNFEKHALDFFEKHKPIYHPVRGAEELLAALQKRGDGALGVLTGNVERIAWWKLEKTGIKKYFQFGLFGGEADNRIELAKLVFAKAKTFFKHDFSPEHITIIGDTIFDVRCAKAIGAKTILILTGGQNSEVPKTETPDLVVDTLTDPRVLSFLD